MTKDQLEEMCASIFYENSQQFDPLRENLLAALQLEREKTALYCYLTALRNAFLATTTTNQEEEVHAELETICERLVQQITGRQVS